MIWKRFSIDISVLYLPGLLAIALSHYLPGDDRSTAFMVFAFIAMGLLDSGHVYATLWRTYFMPQERVRSAVYWWLPPFFFVVFFFWNYFQWGYLAAFVVYATVFHNVRQLLGISKWYQKINKSWSRTSDIFLYLLCGIPFLAFHFRTDVQFAHYYASDELFLFPNPQILHGLLLLYILVLFLWCLFEMYRLMKYKDTQRTLSVFFAAVIYGAAFIYGKNAAQVLFPLIVSHGFSYLALTDLSLRKLSAQMVGYKPLGLVLLTALLFGGIEFLIEEDWINTKSPRHSLTTALLLTPLFCHYYFDAFLWKRTHPDALKIYS